MILRGAVVLLVSLLFSTQSFAIRDFAADDRGQMCKRQEIQYPSGCCPTGSTPACGQCDPKDQCCSQYEGCVACCMEPANGAVSKAKLTLRAARNLDSGFYGTAFEYCQGVCRTHSSSTAHENAYISNRHHCFSKLGKPLLAEPLPRGSLDGVEMFLGSAGDSCTTTCQKSGGKTCSASHLALLNTCDALRERVDCEAGCEAVQGQTSLLPAYIVSSAAKTARPAMCLTGEKAGSNSNKGSECGTQDPVYRRLCACVT